MSRKIKSTRPTKKSAKKSVAKTAKVECVHCAGMGATIVRKGNSPKMVPCSKCDGNGFIRVPKEDLEVGVKITRAKQQAQQKAVARKGSAESREQLAAEMDLDDDLDADLDDLDLDSDEYPVPQSVGKVSKLNRKKLTADQNAAVDIIEERAAFFGCPGKVTAVQKGPVITLYEFAPAKTTRIKRLINLQEDLALALEAEAVMVRRIPGKDVMGIEISNESGERQNVAFRASLKSVLAAKQGGMELPLNLGTDPFGAPVIDDLARMPHLLIAGSTGSGKSVSLNALIGSLLTVCSPKDLQFWMIDPKGVELTHYNGIPHMEAAMVTSPHYAKDMLERLNREMRARLQRLTFAQVRDIVEYNKLAEKEPTRFQKMPRIVLVVDELGDLMMQDRREFTRLFAEISQIARATGIHMICATQRPSVDVLSGKIKVNFPGRMAFKVTSGADSRVVLHKKGAEGLLGRGDMLYLSPTRSALIRVHAPWVPLDDVKEIADKLREIEAQRIEAERKRRQEEMEARRKADEAAYAARPRVVPPPATLAQGQTESIDISLAWAQPKKEV